MKISRQKKIKRYLKFYINNFKFKKPFQIIIDGTFCHAALECKINIKDQVTQYLDDVQVRLYTTACVIKEMQLLGPRVYGALHIAKQLYIRKCDHTKNPRPAADCLLSMVEGGNPHHFIVATTDPGLSEQCRCLPGVPILFVKYKAVILEKPSGMNQEVAQEKMRVATELSEFEKKQLEITKVKSNEDVEEPKRKKRKGPKQPNSLSCLKKKKKPVIVMPPAGKEGIKRKRNRIKNKKLCPIVE